MCFQIEWNKHNNARSTLWLQGPYSPPCRDFSCNRSHCSGKTSTPCTQDGFLVQVTIYRRLLIVRDDHLDKSETYDISQLVREYEAWIIVFDLLSLATLKYLWINFVWKIIEQIIANRIRLHLENKRNQYQQKCNNFWYQLYQHTKMSCYLIKLHY